MVIKVEDTSSKHHNKFVGQKRSQLKIFGKGLLDFAPAGLNDYGESYRDCAIREMKEEISLNLADKLTSVKKSFIQVDNLDKAIPVTRVWSEIFYAKIAGNDLDSIILQESEVEELVIMTKEEISTLANQNPKLFLQDALAAFKIFLDWNPNV